MSGEERMRILNLLKDEKISLEEADQLLASLGDAQKTPIKTGLGKFLRIRINSEDNEKVNVNIPLSVARWALTMVPEKVKTKLRQGEQPIELEEILDHLHEGMEGQRIVDIQDEDGNVVEIYID